MHCLHRLPLDQMRMLHRLLDGPLGRADLSDASQTIRRRSLDRQLLRLELPQVGGAAFGTFRQSIGTVSRFNFLQVRPRCVGISNIHEFLDRPASRCRISSATDFRSRDLMLEKAGEDFAPHAAILRT